MGFSKRVEFVWNKMPKSGVVMSVGTRENGGPNPYRVYRFTASNEESDCRKRFGKEYL